MLAVNYTLTQQCAYSASKFSIRNRFAKCMSTEWVSLRFILYTAECDGCKAFHFTTLFCSEAVSDYNFPILN